jgi:phosphoglycerate dehydrogenase-like enzyme
MPTIAVAVPPDLREVFFSPSTWRELARLGDLRIPDDHADLSDPKVLAGLVAPADIVVTSWTCAPLTEEVLDVAPRLVLLAHTGASVKPFVTEASFARGIRVVQAGAAMAHAVGEQALALTLAMLHRIHRFDYALRHGQPWEVAKLVPRRRELLGCPVGVVGASRTGRSYIALVRSLGAVVTVTDPYLSESETEELGVRRADLPTVMRSSRVVALHAPLLPETERMIGEAELSLLPDGAMLVNTAQAGLIDQEALLAELRTGRIDAALDVFDQEPLPVDHPLRSLPNVLLVPHEAGGTVEAREWGGRIVLDELARFLAGEPLEHEVTREQLNRMG